jgi:hypothetical protein
VEVKLEVLGVSFHPINKMVASKIMPQQRLSRKAALQVVEVAVVDLEEELEAVVAVEHQALNLKEEQVRPFKEKLQHMVAEVEHSP